MLKLTLSVALLAVSISAQATTWHASTPWSKPTRVSLPAGALASTKLDCKDGLTGSHIAGYSAAELQGFASVVKASGLQSNVESVGWLSTEQKCADLQEKLASAKSVSLKQSFYSNITSGDNGCEIYSEESLQLVNEKNKVLMSGLSESNTRVSPSVCAKVPASKRQVL